MNLPQGWMFSYEPPCILEIFNVFLQDLKVEMMHQYLWPWNLLVSFTQIPISRHYYGLSEGCPSFWYLLITKKTKHAKICVNRNLAQDEIHNKYPQKTQQLYIFKMIISRWSDPSQDTIPNFQKQANKFPTQKCCEFFVLVGLYDSSESRKWRSKSSHSLRFLEKTTYSATKHIDKPIFQANFSWWFQNLHPTSWIMPPKKDKK